MTATRGIQRSSSRPSQFRQLAHRSYSIAGASFRGRRCARLAASGVRQSMTRGGAPGENAHMESFFHSLKADAIHGRSFQTR